MYKPKNTPKHAYDLSLGFDRDRGRRQGELTKNKNIKGKHHVRFILEDVFGFADYQEKATSGLGYKLTLTGNSDNAVLNKDNATNIGKIKINSIEWYEPHYTPSFDQQTVLSYQIVKKIPTELHYVERSVFMKEVNTQNLCTFQVGTEEAIILPTWTKISFQQRDRQDSQNLNNDTFYLLPLTSAQCIIGTEKYPDSCIFFNF